VTIFKGRWSISRKGEVVLRVGIVVVVVVVEMVVFLKRGFVSRVVRSEGQDF